jgi:hypothetical protein
MGRMLAVALAAGAVGSAAPVAAQADFQWRGVLEQGHSVEVRGVNGSVRAAPSTDGMVRVEATRTARRSDPASVTLEVVRHPGGVTICAVYPTPRGSRRPNDCRPGGGTARNRNNDVVVDFVVRVPEGVGLDAHVVNGNVNVVSLRSDVRARTVNGAVDIATSGLAEASTVNGSITCRMGRDRMPRHVSFKTVNGGIVLELPDGLDAELRARTVNGTIRSDFPVTVSGAMGRRELRGTIGAGGPELRLETVNGSIRLRRI